jgi:hypothetical protein
VDLCLYTDSVESLSFEEALDLAARLDASIRRSAGPCSVRIAAIFPPAMYTFARRRPLAVTSVPPAIPSSKLTPRKPPGSQLELGDALDVGLSTVASGGRAASPPSPRTSRARAPLWDGIRPRRPAGGARSLDPASHLRLHPECTPRRTPFGTIRTGRPTIPHEPSASKPALLSEGPCRRQQGGCCSSARWDST